MNLFTKIARILIGPPIIIKNPVRIPTIWPGYGCAGKQLQRLHELSNYQTDQSRIMELRDWIHEREQQKKEITGALCRIDNDLKLYRNALSILMCDPMWAPIDIITDL